MKEINLASKTSFTLTPKSPFHFDGTFHKPSHFSNNLALDRWETGNYQQSIRLGDDLYVLNILNKGTINKPVLEITVFSQNKMSESELELLKQEISYRFELNVDLQEFNELAQKDNIFYPIFKKWRGMRSMCQHDLYGLLIISIVLQNATVHRSAQMLDALIARYGIKLLFDNKTIYTFWSPKDLENTLEQELRDLKIGYRAKFIKLLSQDFVISKIDEKELRVLSKDNAKEKLMGLYGVGPETARILLFEALHHYDTFDHIAPWQQKIYSQLFYHKSLIPASKIQSDIKEKYGRYSMLAVHYIWEDIFWKRKNEHIDWLEREIRI